MKRHVISIVIIFLFLIPILIQFFRPGFISMHDDTQVARVITMGKALIEGQFPVRWVSDLGYGYGYPLFNFYAPLPYYTGGVLYALGLNGLQATKMVFLLGILLCALTGYYLGYRIWGRSAGIVLAVLYSYAPYHAVQLFVRGAVGEYWATIFSPLIICGLWQIYTKRGGKILLIVGLAGTILSHTLSGLLLVVMLSVLLVLFLVLSIQKNTHIHFLREISIAGSIALGISVFFWLPALAEMNYTNVQGQISVTAAYSDHFVCLKQFFYSPWGFGGSTKTCEDGLSFALGIPVLLLTCLGSIVYVLKRKTTLFIFGLVGIGITLTSLFFALPYSKFIWDMLPGFAYIQYPWRFLSWTIIGLSILSTGILFLIPFKVGRIAAAMLISFFVVWRTSDIFRPQYTIQNPPSFYEQTQELRFSVSKISDEYLPPDIVKPQTADDVPLAVFQRSEDIPIVSMIEKDIFKKYEVTLSKETEVIAQLAYFPGWVIKVNGQEQPIILKQGLPVISLPKGYSTIELQFKNTIVRTFSNLISLIFVVVLMYKYGKKTIR
jgi:hypothetical protein